MLDAGRATSITTAAHELRRPLLDSPAACSLPALLDDARSRMMAPLSRGIEGLGILVVESRRDGAFDGQDLLAMTALADHAATALETARQFDLVRRERGRADRIIHTMADGLLTLGRDGRVDVMNDAAERLTGRPVSHGAGRAICEVLGCRDGKSCNSTCHLLGALSEGQAFHDDHWVIRTPEGTARVLALSAAPLLSDEAGPTGLVVLLRDETARDEMERFQSELVAAVSHEIRAPLANIDAMVDLMLQRRDGTDGLLEEGLETIRSQTQRLAEFASRTLDVSRLDTGRWHLEPRPLPIGLLVADITHEWKVSRPGRTFAIEVQDGPLWAWADEQAAVTALNNLLSNAMKYSPEGTPITVSAARGPDGWVTVTVADQGPGIPVEKQARIFDRFYRVDGGDSQQVYGYGLGLYTARKLVEAMGGRIGVTSEPGRGSRFAFALPAPETAVRAMA